MTLRRSPVAPLSSGRCRLRRLRPRSLPSLPPQRHSEQIATSATMAQDPQTPLRDSVPRLDSSAGRTAGVLDALARGRRGKVSRTDNALRPVRSGPGIDAIAVTLLLASLTYNVEVHRNDWWYRGCSNITHN